MFVIFATFEFVLKQSRQWRHPIGPNKRKCVVKICSSNYKIRAAEVFYTFCLIFHIFITKVFRDALLKKKKTVKKGTLSLSPSWITCQNNFPTCQNNFPTSVPCESGFWTVEKLKVKKKCHSLFSRSASEKK